MILERMVECAKASIFYSVVLLDVASACAGGEDEHRDSDAWRGSFVPRPALVGSSRQQ